MRKFAKFERNSIDLKGLIELMSIIFVTTLKGIIVITHVSLPKVTKNVRNCSLCGQDLHMFTA